MQQGVQLKNNHNQSSYDNLQLRGIYIIIYTHECLPFVYRIRFV